MPFTSYSRRLLTRLLATGNPSARAGRRKLDFVLLEDRSTPSFTISDPIANEGDIGASNTLTFVVTQDDLNIASDVAFAITGGSAVAGTDFVTLASGTLNFTADTVPQSQNIVVTLIGNQKLQSNRDIRIELSDPVNSTIADGVGSGTITEDDAVETIAVTGGAGQSAGVGQAFANPIGVTVRNAAGNLVENAQVTFTAPSGSGVASFTPSPIPVVTNSSGVATSGTITANAVAGANYTVGIASGTKSATTTLTNTLPTISISSPTVAEGDIGANPLLTFDVTLSGSSVVTTSTVDYAVTGGSAVVGTDFQPLAKGTLTFDTSPGNNSNKRSLNIAVIGNQRFESNRTIVITLSNGQNLTITGATGTGTISDDDSPNSLAITSGNNQTAVASATFATPLTATVTNKAGKPVEGVTVAFVSPSSGPSLTNNSIAVTTDASGVASSGTITANSTAGTYSVTATADGGTNPGNSFTLTNAVPPVIEINSQSITEGDNGALSPATTFTVTLTGTAPSVATVSYSITGGTAVSGVDFQPLASGTLTFATGAGPQTRTIPLTIIGNQILQSNRTIIVTLTSPTNSVLGANTTGTLTITDDDAPVTLTSLSGNGQVTVSTGNYDSPLTLRADNANGFPVQGVSITFSSPSGSPGLTNPSISVSTDALGVASTGLITANDFAGLFTVTANQTGGGLTPVVYTLSSTVGLSVSDVSRLEGNSGTTNFPFIVTLSSPSSNTVTVNFNTSDVTAVAGRDYTATSGTLVFIPGETSKTVDVAVTGNSVAEPSRTFLLNLSGSVNAVISRGAGIGFIVNDDSFDTIPPLPAGDPGNLTALAPQNGNAPITILNKATGESLLIPNPLIGFGGPVSLALGDVTGDARADLVVSAGAGGGPRVVVVDGSTGRISSDFYAFDAAFRGGVSVVVADLTGDGRADLVVGAGAGGGPNVRIYDGGTSELLVDTFVFNINFRGGVNLAVGDVNGDGLADVIVGAGAGGGPNVKAFDPRNLQTLLDFFAYDPSFRGGVNVAFGDLNNDGVGELVTGAGRGGSPEVRVHSRNLELLSIFPGFESNFNGGLGVKVGRLAGFDRSVIFVSAGIGGSARVRAYDFVTGLFVYDAYLSDPNMPSGATVS